MNLGSHAVWIETEAPHSDVVLTSRARLARNLAGFPFVNRASAAQCNEILNIARRVLLRDEIAPGMMWVDLCRSTDRDRRLLVERHLISKQLAEAEGPRAVAVSEDEALSVMINEEDHLRMQFLAPGLQLDPVFDRINVVDDLIESHVDYAFSERWGYLTACPTNVGTGIRFSVMMHLPGLKITNEIERVRRAAKDLHLAVRGYYGEGSESAGDFYQISNQLTLGCQEHALLKELRDNIVPRIIDYEHQARRLLATRNATLLEDRVQRARAVLGSARLLGTEEAMKLLSRVRLGAQLGRLSNIDVAVVNRLFVEIQPAHLQARSSQRLSGDELREARARLVREALGSAG